MNFFNRAVESTSNNNIKGRTSKVALLTKAHFSKMAELPHYYFGETAPPPGFDAVGELHLRNGGDLSDLTIYRWEFDNLGRRWTTSTSSIIERSGLYISFLLTRKCSCAL